MNADTAEMAALEPAQLLPLQAGAVTSERLPARRRLRVGGRLAEAQRAALRDSFAALAGSRLIVLVVGTGAAAVLGFAHHKHLLNPRGVTSGFGAVGNVLAAPFAHWDAAWYLLIAHHGYYQAHLGLARSAFFPLYPLLVGLFGGAGGVLVVSGVLVSLAAFAVALYGLHRLTTLELRHGAAREWAHPDVPRLAVLLTAFAPMAFFFSAVYSESLYLALSIGVFWSARHGRWAVVGVLGGLAAATRSAGIVLLLPTLMLYLYGPREDRPPDRPRAIELAGVLVTRGSGAWRPRYRLRRDALWLALIPAGLGAFMIFLDLHGGEAVMPFHAQAVWQRVFAGPFGGVWSGAVAAFDGLRQLLHGSPRPVYFTAAHGSPFINAWHDLVLFGFLLAAVPALVGVLRKLPLAYGAYVLAALAMPLSYPTRHEPLMSLPRFELVLFPLTIWFAAQLVRRPRLRVPALAVSTLLLALFTAQFAAWHWVA